MVVFCMAIVRSICLLSIVPILSEVGRVWGGDVGLGAHILLAVRLGESRIG